MSEGPNAPGLRETAMPKTINEVLDDTAEILYYRTTKTIRRQITGALTSVLHDAAAASREMHSGERLDATLALVPAYRSARQFAKLLEAHISGIEDLD